MRVGKAVLVLVACLPRLDYPVFGRALESWDRGYVSYACFVHVEAVNSNPVAIEFCRIVEECITGVERRDMREQRQRYLRFRWHLTYSLIKNETIVSTRKRKQSMRSVAVESF
ncbi:hypothetical protein ACOME3_007520 [Neoechinorhynchus agilis]